MVILSATPLKNPQSNASGFTLIEVLVVMVILGIAIGGVSLSLEVLRGRDTDLALERLRWVLEATAERARIRGQALSFDMLADGYRFSLRNADGRWQRYDDPPIFQEKTLPDTLHWGVLSVDGHAVNHLIFNARAPRFILKLQTPDSRVTLQGHVSGQVDLQRSTMNVVEAHP